MTLAFDRIDDAREDISDDLWACPPLLGSQAVATAMLHDTCVQKAMWRTARGPPSTDGDHRLKRRRRLASTSEALHGARLERPKGRG